MQANFADGVVSGGEIRSDTLALVRGYGPHSADKSCEWAGSGGASFAGAGCPPRASFNVQLEQHVVARRPLDGSSQILALEGLLLQPGRTVLTLASDMTPVSPGGGDARLLAFALLRF